jgi:hypothetical protein
MPQLQTSNELTRTNCSFVTPALLTNLTELLRAGNTKPRPGPVAATLSKTDNKNNDLDWRARIPSRKKPVPSLQTGKHNGDGNLDVIYSLAENLCPSSSYLSQILPWMELDQFGKDTEKTH